MASRKRKRKRQPKPLPKPTTHVELGKSRRQQVPEPGAMVLYPIPLPPVSHLKREPKTGEIVMEWLPVEPDPEVPGPPPGPKRNSRFDELPWEELAVPVGTEEWHQARVIEVERVERTVDPDGYLALIQPLDADTGKPFGSVQSISVVFLRPPEN